MKKRVLIASGILAGLVVVGYLIFDFLGGNNPIKIELIERQPETLIGRTFRGIPRDEQLAANFQELEVQKSLNPGSYLHTIYEIEPAGKHDTMVVFVGINKQLPLEDMETRKFTQSKYLLATIQSNRWVMPSPESIKEKLQSFAAENELKLSGIFIDRIISASEVQVIAPIE
ncbi:hypothetical protein PBT90_14905 [Algoriphagus halophytocola]|uniref:GyrI-like small molecule binding domain-containing protein n=1 Tax=Algoriphagus halophytocola TaxID=2991499 RepID=A0ABY6MQ55_9BACT|nr:MULTISPECIES: hypothetical protein [unclassified Algoriphagus]UZD24669.1 hypothetical protein OM944_09240 [Algoriphagus sp. TR-M5]WBL42037.1 hypothetical protein PBT90_14905 [Algoriphagus sp. TR-M9]